MEGNGNARMEDFPDVNVKTGMEITLNLNQGWYHHAKIRNFQYAKVLYVLIITLS